MAEIAILGGAMNPICIHHLMAGVAVHAQTGLDVWFMPCFDHNFGKQMATSQQRLSMCLRGTHWLNDLFPDKFTSSGYEISKRHNGRTYELMDMLVDEHPEHRFHFVIGMDNANIINKPENEGGWYRGADLIEKHPFIVCPRPGWQAKVDWFKQGPHQEIDFWYAGQSKLFREAMEQKRYAEAAAMVGSFNWDYIAEHELYGYESEAA